MREWLENDKIGSTPQTSHVRCPGEADPQHRGICDTLRHYLTLRLEHTALWIATTGPSAGAVDTPPIDCSHRESAIARIRIVNVFTQARLNTRPYFAVLWGCAPENETMLWSFQTDRTAGHTRLCFRTLLVFSAIFHTNLSCIKSSMGKFTQRLTVTWPSSQACVAPHPRCHRTPRGLPPPGAPPPAAHRCMQPVHHHGLRRRTRTCSSHQPSG